MIVLDGEGRASRLFAPNGKSHVAPVVLLTIFFFFVCVFLAQDFLFYAGDRRS
ncbi:membrane-associated protein, putative [Bodo saltans]|uniref:Membrane-associated protein, putative n=1 Tax=Bodo saltans TaxID=75058 RepID=A0A0S4IVG5_BODSA|nr:membrane-associated protein, putative [Bodo saltans]|eukprot:CUF55193.1 membrane-associated protein, putative [Bodo saltans]